MKQPTPKRIDVIQSAFELAQIIAEDVTFAEQDSLIKGDEFISIVEKSNPKAKPLGLDQLKIDAIQQAIDDISTGGKTLRTNTIGVVFADGELWQFVEPHDNEPKGEILYSINLNIFAFEGWKNEEEADLPQEAVNCTIYRLIWDWAQLLQT